MPAAFDACVSSGGRVRRKSIKGGYINLCFKGGKSFAGHPHKKRAARGRKTGR
jgi:hypothetical protein